MARRGQAGVWQGTPCRVKSVLMGDIGGGQQLKSCRGPVGAGRGRSGNGLGPCGLPWSQAGGGGTRDSALCFGAPPLRWKQSPEATVLVTAGPTQPQTALSDSHAPSPQSQDPGQIPPFARGKSKQDLGWNDNLRSHIVEYYESQTSSRDEGDTNKADEHPEVSNRVGPCHWAQNKAIEQKFKGSRLPSERQRLAEEYVPRLRMPLLSERCSLGFFIQLQQGRTCGTPQPYSEIHSTASSQGQGISSSTIRTVLENTAGFPHFVMDNRRMA